MAEYIKIDKDGNRKTIQYNPKKSKVLRRIKEINRKKHKFYKKPVVFYGYSTI
jgi:hypothetical protein